MSQLRYVALLRGINVGGNNVIRMADLRACFEGLGFSRVETYIQSGNVVFDASARKSSQLLVRAIERALSDAFSYDSRIVLASAADLAAIVKQAPAGFGKLADQYRYDVIFPRPPLQPKVALPQLPINPDVDTATAGAHALYFRRLIAKATKSKLGKLTSLPIYQELTIRNWNTTTKLLQMASAVASD